MISTPDRLRSLGLNRSSSCVGEIQIKSPQLKETEMNGTGKWLLGVASALIVGLIGWSLHTTQVHDVELAGQKAEME